MRSVKRKFLLLLIFIGLIVLIVPKQQTPIQTFAQTTTIQSDLMTSPLNTTFYMTVGSESSVFRNNSKNYYLVSVDVLNADPSIISWYNVGFYTRLMNEDLNWTHFDESPMTGILTMQNKFFDYVFEVDVNETFPSSFFLSVGLRYTENVDGASDSKSSAYWTSIVNITINDNVPVATIVPRVGYNETSTVTKTETITEAIEVIAPFVSIPPRDAYYESNTPYNITWKLEGSHSGNYRVDVIYNKQAYSLLSGKWFDGQLITVNSIPKTEIEAVYNYILEADNEMGLHYTDTVSISVVNSSNWTEQYPVIVTDIAAIPPQFAPISIQPIIIGLIVMIVTQWRRKLRFRFTVQHKCLLY